MRHIFPYLFIAFLFSFSLQVSLAECAWRIKDSNPVEMGLHSLSGADGETLLTVKGGLTCLTNKPGATPPSMYLYFQLDPPMSPPANAPIYIQVRYLDNEFGGGMSLEYDSNTGNTQEARYHPADDQVGGLHVGSEKWETAIFKLDKPLFQRRQNLGADFRLTGSSLEISSVNLLTAVPSAWKALENTPQRSYPKMVTIGDGKQLIFGGYDPTSMATAQANIKALKERIPAFKAIGFTSHEVYVRWNLCEPVEGKYDWSIYDAYVNLYKKENIKWVPFLIVGSAYSLPDWFYKKKGYQGYVCLEHNMECDVQSLWNPAMREQVTKFIQAFCEHYRNSGVIESILLGITGNYGEAIYPASGNDWTADIHGAYHTHMGFWAVDPYAIQSFREWLKKKYADDSHLQTAWNDHGISLATVKPMLQKDAPNDRAWLDFMHWYVGSMTDWSAFWLRTTRENFPKGDIYLCTGGDSNPMLGSDFGEQARVAAESGAGVRITNEGSNYRLNVAITRWVASACSQYGAYFSFEPAGSVDQNGVVARIYNAAASGAKGLHYYQDNVFNANPQNLKNFIKYGHMFTEHKPIVEIAVYYPETDIMLHGLRSLALYEPLFDRFNFDYMSDDQIRDGGLKHVKALILMNGASAEPDTWKRIAAWKAQGGLILYPSSMGALQTVDGKQMDDLVLKGNGGRALVFDGDAASSAYRDFLVSSLRDAPELSPGTRAMVKADGVDDQVYCTLASPDALLWLNYTDKTMMKNGISLPPRSIELQKIEDNNR
jgi:hypothetical protein